MRLIVTLSLAVACVTCADTQVFRGSYVLRDSAGIQIVEVERPEVAPTERWTVSPAPLIEFGQNAPADVILYRVRGATQLGNGQFVVANGGAYQLQWYDAAGQLLRTAGREGGGPGEFSALNWIVRHGADSVMVLDSRLQRLSVFDAAGRFIRAIAVDVWGNRHGTFSDGSVLIAQNRYGGEGLVRQQVALWRVDPGDGHRDSLGAYEGEEQLVERQGNMVLLRPAPFGREGVFAVRGLHVLVGDQGAYQVREYSLDRDLIRLFRVEEPARSVTANDIAALREQLIAEFRGTNIDAWRRTVEEQSYPDVLPAHGAMVVDAVERVWIQDYPRPGSTIVDWWIFDRDWRPVGATRLPTAFEVYEIGEEYVLGKWSDSLDVEHVGMYGLSPP